MPAHVRTARLVAVTVARRGGWPESLLESVRQGVGEACTLALRAAGPDGTLTVELDDRGPGLVSRVWPAPSSAGSAGEDLPWAVLAGLTDEVAIEDHDGVSVLRLSWLP
ncbi:ATP-binding protein [Angustibacter sp. McL0619]|uniref:ATP-binding protein n=1 Tax=Angustibacter sp. McL0619 TaxID=3415676 RepID=UPI003CF393EB